MNIIPLDEESVFYVARRLSDPEAREAYLRQVCGGDAALHDRVSALLRVSEQEASFLEALPFDATVDVPAPAENPGAVIGPYRLLEAIGEGGMGTVYMAAQAEPVRRRVALKVIKPGMDSKQVVARFEAERQALAMMDHPNIAKVLDGGMTPAGRPYFVMELVRGLPITEYCDRQELTIAERLELFVLVCRAVQHAHQKGVIHRDLKPSNILVTDIDGVAVPKVIDFGVAKATGQALTDKTLFTGFHQFVGTPLYTSPEQADLTGADVDTRSDVYSLGVLLYELLTGTTPYDTETLGRAAFDEMRRIIREEDPPRPSTRLSSLGERLTTVSARRKTDPRRLGASVKGELDWVVMKALEKDRRRRYETANDFAADVLNYLADRPVAAFPPTRRYRLAKFVRHQRTALATAGLVSAALVVGAVAAGWQAMAATAARGRAEEHLAQGLQAVEELYEHVASRALTEMRWAPLPRAFLLKVLPFYERFAEGRRVDASLGRAHRRIGEIRMQLGQFPKAEEALRRSESIWRALLAVGPDDPDHLRDLAACCFALGEIPQPWEPRMKSHGEALAIRERLADRFPGIPLHRGELAASHGAIAGWRVWSRMPGAEGHLDRALRLREGLASGDPADPDLACDVGSTLRAFAEFHGFAGRNAEAEPYSRRAFVTHDRLLKEHPTSPRYWQQLTWDCTNLGSILLANGAWAEAARVLDRGVAMAEGLASDEPSFARHREHLANAIALRATALGRIGDQAALDRDVERLLGSLDRIDLDTVAAAAWAYCQTDTPARPKPEVVVRLARHAVASRPDSVHFHHVLGMTQYRAGAWDEAIATLKRANELEHDAGFAFNGFFLAMAHQRKGEPEEARRLYDRSVAWMAEHKTTDPNAFRYRDEAAQVLGPPPPS